MQKQSHYFSNDPRIFLNKILRSQYTIRVQEPLCFIVNKTIQSINILAYLYNYSYSVVALQYVQVPNITTLKILKTDLEPTESLRKLHISNSKFPHYRCRKAAH